MALDMPEFPPNQPTVAMVDTLLAQAARDHASPHWTEGRHAGTLEAVETWLASLRDWLVTLE